MKHSVVLFALLVSGLVRADANSDAFNAGASFGKGSSSQGTSSLKNPDTVAGSIPGYTANPPEKDYYGGVSGGDGGLSNKGQQALQNSGAGQAVIDSGIKNPLPVIDPSAPFITIGKNAESTSGSITDGTSSQCTSTSVSKSTFENFTCSADVAVQRTCQRNTAITGHNEIRSVTKVITVAPQAFSYGEISASSPSLFSWSFALPAGASVLSGTLTAVVGDSPGLNWSTTLNYPGGAASVGKEGSKTVGLASFTVPGNGLVTGSWQNTNSANNYYQIMLFRANVLSGNITLSATVTIVTSENVWVSDTTTPAVCPDSPGGKLTGSVCTVPGGDRTTVVNGVPRTVHSDCWQYTDTYLVSENTQGTCSSLINDPACTRTTETCSEYVGSDCSHKDYTYQCQKVFSSTGLVCGGQYFCRSGDCSDTDGAGDSGFDTAVAKLAGLASAAADVTNDQITVKAFTGRAMSCRKAFAGFSNCCKDSGWGQDTGLSACNDDELALGKAKAKKITVSVGDRCDHQVLGVCVQKSQVYCVFDGKLARIIQEQGRRDQLGIGFGSGDSPNCSGITVPQLQGINFDLINFADFYSDLINNQKIPDSGVMVQQIKDRIAAQVQQQQSSGGAK